MALVSPVQPGTARHGERPAKPAQQINKVTEDSVLTCAGAVWDPACRGSGHGARVHHAASGRFCKLCGRPLLEHTGAAQDSAHLFSRTSFIAIYLHSGHAVIRTLCIPVHASVARCPNDQRKTSPRRMKPWAWRRLTKGGILAPFWMRTCYITSPLGRTRCVRAMHADAQKLVVRVHPTANAA